ncbi:hypothetical protein BDY24DRAFT_379934 [Mrakia frigida]|uniref:uncharacterized protein n=1 Tax=Mrakia frigida TaxID=29902 RepID=UPI003FCBF476
MMSDALKSLSGLSTRFLSFLRSVMASVLLYLFIPLPFVSLAALTNPHVLPFHFWLFLFPLDVLFVPFFFACFFTLGMGWSIDFV